MRLIAERERVGGHDVQDDDAGERERDADESAAACGQRCGHFASCDCRHCLHLYFAAGGRTVLVLQHAAVNAQGE